MYEGHILRRAHTARHRAVPPYPPAGPICPRTPQHPKHVIFHTNWYMSFKWPIHASTTQGRKRCVSVARGIQDCFQVLNLASPKRPVDQADDD